MPTLNEYVRMFRIQALDRAVATHDSQQISAAYDQLLYGFGRNAGVGLIRLLAVDHVRTFDLALAAHLMGEEARYWDHEQEDSPRATYVYTSWNGMVDTLAQTGRIRAAVALARDMALVGTGKDTQPVSNVRALFADTARLLSVRDSVQKWKDLMIVYAQTDRPAAYALLAAESAKFSTLAGHARTMVAVHFTDMAAAPEPIADRPALGA